MAPKHTVAKESHCQYHPLLLYNEKLFQGQKPSTCCILLALVSLCVSWPPLYPLNKTIKKGGQR